MYQVRPRFQVETDHTIEEMVGRIQYALQDENAPIRGRVRPTYATLFLPHQEQHYWSPVLNVSFEETESGSLMRGLYGPRPSVWTMFVFFYGLIAFAVMIITIIGFSNMSLDRSGAILWLVPILILLFCSLYLVSYLGKRKGHDQMVTIHHFLEKSTGVSTRSEPD